MNRLISVVVLALVGCAAGGDYKPTTQAGAQCKVECAKAMSSCSGSSYTCDRAASTCMASCKDMDLLGR